MAAASLGALAVAVRPTALLPLLPISACVVLTEWTTHTRRTGTAVEHSPAATGAAAAASALLVLVSSALVDRICYGRWVLVAHRFVRFNVLNDGAVYYGTHPWHWYVSTALPAALGVHLPLVITGVLSALQGAEIYTAAPALGAASTLAVLSLSPHKELRFVYPLVHPLLLGYAGAALAKMSPTRRRRWAVFLILFNLPVGAYLSLWHQRAPMAVMEALRNDGAKGTLTHVDLLTRCHQTPGLSALYGGPTTPRLTMLHCPPPSLHRLAAQSDAVRSRRSRRLAFLSATLQRTPTRARGSVTRGTPDSPMPDHPSWSGWGVRKRGARATTHATGGRVPSLRAEQEARGMPWMPSQRTLRALYPRAEPGCANECDCFLSSPADAIAKRYPGGDGFIGVWWWLVHGPELARRRVTRVLRQRRMLEGGDMPNVTAVQDENDVHGVMTPADNAEVAAGARLSTLPSHIVIDEDVARDPQVERVLQRRGFAVRQAFVHQVESVAWWPQQGLGWPQIQVRKILLLTREVGA